MGSMPRERSAKPIEEMHAGTQRGTRRWDRCRASAARSRSKRRTRAQIAERDDGIDAARAQREADRRDARGHTARNEAMGSMPRERSAKPIEETHAGTDRGTRRWDRCRASAARSRSKRRTRAQIAERDDGIDAARAQREADRRDARGHRSRNETMGSMPRERSAKPIEE